MLRADRFEHRRDIAVGMWHESHGINLSSALRPPSFNHTLAVDAAWLHRADRTGAARWSREFCAREFQLRAARRRPADFSPFDVQIRHRDRPLNRRRERPARDDAGLVAVSKYAVALARDHPAVVGLQPDQFFLQALSALRRKCRAADEVDDRALRTCSGPLLAATNCDRVRDRRAEVPLRAATCRARPARPAWHRRQRRRRGSPRTIARAPSLSTNSSKPSSPV